ncbi:MAG: hypothetical protein GKR89_00885 [Candidatus Latescibacteria bacterium]|nr:hypothetical protein [Candidatus Latescibacterota bacterium]
MNVNFTKHLKLGFAALFVLAGSSFALPDEQIAFMSNRDGGWTIYTMDTEGGNPVRLTPGGANDGAPVWSPDGSRMVFVSDRDGNNEIYVMDADGGNPVRLTDNAGNDDVPSWSPDGTRIVFHSDREANRTPCCDIFAGNDWNDTEIYVMNADGSDPINLTNTDNDDRGIGVWDGWPSWSPHGDQILFSSDRDWVVGDELRAELYVMDPDGGEPYNLTQNNLHDRNATWSPDGSQIVFAASTDFRANPDIWVMNAAGGDQINLTNNPDSDDNWPSWSPDGSHIVFRSRRSGSSDIWVMQADGSEARNLTQSDSVDLLPSWSAGIGGTTLIEALSWGRIKARSD